MNPNKVDAKNFFLFHQIFKTARGTQSFTFSLNFGKVSTYRLKTIDANYNEKAHIYRREVRHKTRNTTTNL